MTDLPYLPTWWLLATDSWYRYCRLDRVTVPYVFCLITVTEWKWYRYHTLLIPAIQMGYRTVGTFHAPFEFIYANRILFFYRVIFTTLERLVSIQYLIPLYIQTIFVRRIVVLKYWIRLIIIETPKNCVRFHIVADPDPGSGAFLTPGSEMVEKSRSASGMNISDHISESLETIFWVKIPTLLHLVFKRELPLLLPFCV